MTTPRQAPHRPMALILTLSALAVGCATPQRPDVTPDAPDRAPVAERDAAGDPARREGDSDAGLGVIACQEAEMPGGGGSVPAGWIPDAPGVEALFPQGAPVVGLIQEWTVTPAPSVCHKIVFAEGTDVVGHAATVAGAMGLRKSDIGEVWFGKLGEGSAVSALDRRVMVCAERTSEALEAEVRQAIGDALGPQGTEALGGVPQRTVVEWRPGRRELVLHRDGYVRHEALDGAGFARGDVTLAQRPCPQRIYTVFFPLDIERPDRLMGEVDEP